MQPLWEKSCFRIIVPLAGQGAAKEYVCQKTKETVKKQFQPEVHEYLY